MNMESLVTACHHRAVNTSLLLARRESYRGRQQSEGQAEDFTRQAERRCMAVASSCR